ncbi:hypothetical protein Cpap_0179 [Ruminiclostridium papyrosolvens DSM 2782]|uniref:Sigma-70 region 4 type 2 n=1 Tax=Ruminiclostridium papyrosolvens DSM 2782 TaxID=588581 RepID=F1TIJ4_9FIRM|nr:hypothetical protein [Ruminiclostridium papyrosolvens]EGD45811.1 hypothetical protein Cpap_0179 [Ruminiclostridium papyrosolvens DSM 2782]WES33870.1 sigma-70 family RNA polymerase sigma factor [Ruminiclostridium papyrosolvens DSM 2782]
MSINHKEYTPIVNRERIFVSREVYQEYYRQKEHESYLNKLSTKHNLSFSEYEEKGVQIEYILASRIESHEDAVIRNEMLKTLKSALMVLSKEELLLIKAIYFDEVSERALAQKKNIPQKTLNNRKKRILKKLKKLIEK